MVAISCSSLDCQSLLICSLWNLGSWGYPLCLQKVPILENRHFGDWCCVEWGVSCHTRHGWVWRPVLWHWWLITEWQSRGMTYEAQLNVPFESGLISRCITRLASLEFLTLWVILDKVVMLKWILITWFALIDKIASPKYSERLINAESWVSYLSHF